MILPYDEIKFSNYPIMSFGDLLYPGSLTEGIFVDMIYSPEPNADQKGKALAKETQKNKNLKLKSNKKS